MASIFKNIGKGIGYFFLFPGLLIAIALYAVFGLIVFIFQFFKLIFLFFSGRNLFSDLPEDIELKLIKEKQSVAEEKEEANNQLSLYPSDSIVYGSGYSSPVVEEKKVEEEPPEVEIEEDIQLEEGEQENND